MASEVPLCYTEQSVGCEMTTCSLVASVVLGQHWCALAFSIHECQSATSLMLGFICVFSSWVNLVCGGAMDFDCPGDRTLAHLILYLTYWSKSSLSECCETVSNDSAHNLFLRNILFFLPEIVNAIPADYYSMQFGTECMRTSHRWRCSMPSLLNHAWSYSTGLLVRRG